MAIKSELELNATNISIELEKFVSDGGFEKLTANPAVKELVADEAYKAVTMTKLMPSFGHFFMLHTRTSIRLLIYIGILVGFRLANGNSEMDELDKLVELDSEPKPN